LGWLGVANLA